MRPFFVVLTKLKRWLRQKKSGQIQVSTYVGSFEAPKDESGQPADFNDFLNYIKANKDLKRVAFDTINVSDAKQINVRVENTSNGIQLFHQVIKESCLDFAKYVVVLRNQMK